MPGRKRLDDYDCALARTVDRIGDAWSLLIIRDAAIGARRFGEFQASLRIAKNILSARLKRLIDADVLTFDDGNYSLTERGWQLLPALIALMQWGDQWAFDGTGPVQVKDERGHAVEPMRLRAGNATVLPQQLRFSPSATATPETAVFLEMASARRADVKD